MSTERADFSQLRKDTNLTDPDQVQDIRGDGLEFWKLEELSKEAVEQYQSIKERENFEVGSDFKSIALLTGVKGWRMHDMSCPSLIRPRKQMVAFSSHTIRFLNLRNHIWRRSGDPS